MVNSDVDCERHSAYLVSDPAADLSQCMPNSTCFERNPGRVRGGINRSGGIPDRASRAHPESSTCTSVVVVASVVVEAPSNGSRCECCAGAVRIRALSHFRW